MSIDSWKYLFVGAARAAEITGVTEVQQRNLRRRGYMPYRGDGANYSFTPQGLAFLLVLNRLAAFGMGPQDAKKIADEAADAIFYYALRSKGAPAIKSPEKLFAREADRKFKGFLVVDRNLIAHEVNYLDDFFAGEDGQEVALILDLDTLGEQLTARAAEPLVTVSN
ncbi:MAG: hypothetical protein AAGB02_05045 [Pseudomonadota bacterium]